MELLERVQSACALFACSASLSLSLTLMGTVMWSEYFLTKLFILNDPDNP